MRCDQKNCPDLQQCYRRDRAGMPDRCLQREVEFNLAKDTKYKKGSVDIIVPAYNCKEYLNAAFESLDTLDYDKDKLGVIVVDDGSSDGSREEIERMRENFKGLKMSCIFREQNLGANYSRNEALLLSNSEYVFFMDADSWLGPDVISKLASALEGTPKIIGYAYCGFNRVWETPDGERLDVWRPPYFDARTIKQSNYISMMSLVKREAIPDSGLDVSIKRFQDWDLWLTLLDKGIVGKCVDEVLFGAFVRPAGISHSQEDMQELKDVVLKKHGLKG